MKNNSYKIKKGKQGFTIIETLVAITILMISIVGPLTIAHKGLLDALYSAQQTTASYLAQDAIEYIKNVKADNRIDIDGGTSVDWLDGLVIGSVGCVSTTPCSVNTVVGNPSVPDGIQNCDPTPPSTSCLLYLSSTDGYVPVASGNSPTPFSRYFYIKPVPGNALNEAKLTVVVSWKTGTVDNIFTYEDELFNVVQ